MNPQTPFGGGQDQQQYGAITPQPNSQTPYTQSVQQSQPLSQYPQQQAAPVGYGAPVPPSQPAHTPKTYGRVSKAWLILAIVFIVLTLAAAGAFIWAYMNYVDNRDNVESKVSAAVSKAVKEEGDKNAADFIEREKQPTRIFTGPDDYGSLSFNYPKTWSTYVAKDASNGGSYEAYFNPVLVPTVSQTQQYALRVLIEEKDYDRVLDTYKTLVTKGDLKTSPVKINDQDATRIEGAFTKDIRGAAVVFKIRDKTVTVRTDAQPFIEPDFNTLVKTITFNK